MCVCVCPCYWYLLDCNITTQSAPALSSKLLYVTSTGHPNMCVCVCRCLVLLYITVQSDPVTSSSLNAALVLPSGGQLYLLRKYMITRGLGDVWEDFLCGVYVDRAFLVLPSILSSRSIFPSSLIFCVYYYLIYWY